MCTLVWAILLLLLPLDSIHPRPVPSVSPREYIVTPILDVVRPKPSPLSIQINKPRMIQERSPKIKARSIQQPRQARTESIVIYDDVHMSLVEPQDSQGAKSLHLALKAFGQNVSLNIWPLWSINQGWGFVDHKRYVLGPRIPSNTLREIVFHKSNHLEPTGNVTNLYVNVDNSTALLVTHFYAQDKFEVELFGMLNEKMVILPAWHHLAPVYQMPTQSSSRGVRHTLVDYPHNISPINVHGLVNRIQSSVNHRRNVPEVHYPEVTLLLDYYTYRLHHKNVEQLWRYYLLFFSRLDLIYRQLTSPRIELRLKSIYIAEKPLDFQLKTPKRMEGNVTGGFLNALKAIHEFGLFAHDQRAIFRESDIVLVITGQDLCLANNRTDYESCDYASIQGQSFVGGACQHDDPWAERMNVAVVEDRGSFDGVSVAAHELGHLLGSVHDGQWPLSGILGPGGRGCAPDGGYLMSQKHTMRSQQSTEWSVCSMEQFDYFLKLPESLCLYNRPRSDEM